MAVVTRDGLPVRSWVFPGNTPEPAPAKAGVPTLTQINSRQCAWAGS
jgi:hypothetical protein